MQLLLMPGLGFKGTCRWQGTLWRLLWVGCRHCHLYVLREWHDLTYILGEKYFLSEQFFLKIEKIKIKLNDKFGSQTWVCHYMNYRSLETFICQKWRVCWLISLLKVGLIVICLSGTLKSPRVCLTWKLVWLSTIASWLLVKMTRILNQDGGRAATLFTATARLSLAWRTELPMPHRDGHVLKCGC